MVVSNSIGVSGAFGTSTRDFPAVCLPPVAGAFASRFDGTNDYLSRGADLTGNVDTKKVTLFFVGKPAALPAILYDIGFNMTSGGIGTRFLFNNVGKFAFVATNAAGGTILDIVATTGVSAGAWATCALSADLATAGARHMYINSASNLSVVTFTNDTMDNTRANYHVGSDVNGNQKFNGDIAVFYLNFGAYIDLSVESNLRKFVTADNRLVWLGANGEIPTGSAPIVYLSNDLGTFPPNRGTGGGFTETGSLVIVPGPSTS